jgi:hypothetical protein
MVVSVWLTQTCLKQILFHCYFVGAMKLTQLDLYNLYVDLEYHFSQDQFHCFVNFVEFKYDTLLIVWYIVPTTQMDYVAFYFKEQFYMLHKTNKCIGVLSMVTKEDWKIVCKYVKN